MTLRSFVSGVATVLILLAASALSASAFLQDSSVATRIDSAWDPIMASACAGFRFTFVGKVREVGSDTFQLDDGSKHTLQVVVPDHSGVIAGEWVKATGTLTREGDEPVLLATDVVWQGYPSAPRMISGRVLCEGIGVSDVFVLQDGGEGCYTDSDGHYSLKVPNGWTGHLRATHELYSIPDQWLENVVVDQPNVGFEATRLCTISGRVRTADGTPVSNVVFDAGPYRCITDSDGNYSLRVNPHWSGYVGPQHNVYRFDPEYRQYLDVITDHTGQDFQAIAKPVISGHIRTADGAPVSGVELWAYPDRCETDSDGRYVLHMPPGWSGAVQVSHDLYTFSPDSREYSDVTTDVSEQDYEATAKPVISGHLRTADGTPVHDAQVHTLSGEFAYSDLNGRYSIRVPSGWSGTVIVQHDLYSFSPDSRPYTSVTADIPEQDFEAIEKPVISGHIRSATGAPVDGVYVYASTGECASVDSYGYYALRVPYGWSGTASVSLHNTYYFSPAVRQYGNLTADQPNQDLEALPNPVISGCIRNALGEPVANVGIWADSSYGYQESRTDGSGHYATSVPRGWSGTVSVITSHELYTFSPDAREYTNVTSDQPDSDFQALDKPVISGYVRTTDGDPVVDAYVEGCYTDASGYYSIRVPTGWSGSVVISQHDFYTFTPNMHDYANVTTDQPSQNFEATANPIISGRIRSASGTPVEDVYLRADGITARVDSDGCYRLPVPTGWSGMVTVDEHYVYTFVPQNRIYNCVTEDSPDQDYDAIVKPVISGYIKTGDGSPVESVAVRTDNFSQWTQTDSTGYYRLAVASGWSGTLIVSHSLCTFNPDSHTYANVTADRPNEGFVAIANPVISGRVRTAAGTAVACVGVDVSGIGMWSTDADGYYAAFVPVGWSGTVTVSHSLYTIVPASRSYENLNADQENQDYEATSPLAVSSLEEKNTEGR